MGACSYVLTFFIECHKAVRLVSCFHHAYWWRQPVETQNFASPEEVCAINSCYNQRVVIAFPACETQDFASLLYMSRFLYMYPLRHRSMKNRMTRKLSDIAIWNIPLCAFRINTCDKINNANLMIPLYLFANGISGENTRVLSIL